MKEKERRERKKRRERKTFEKSTMRKPTTTALYSFFYLGKDRERQKTLEIEKEKGVVYS